MPKRVVQRSKATEAKEKKKEEKKKMVAKVARLRLIFEKWAEEEKQKKAAAEQAKKNAKLAKEVVANRAFWIDVTRRYWRKTLNGEYIEWHSSAAAIARYQGRDEVPVDSRPFPRWPPTWT